ncbi:type I-G CRISPR-associated helicase/endonuclease Cas3g [Alicyclobacillus acidocaldarius]|nr:CRISPR-associated helicase Cas3' [Alicyclobacillus acidocaldarius]
MDFSEFFIRATGSPPYPWQSRIATASTWPDLLRIPTGAGKTGVILAWLWRRLHGGDEMEQRTGRRLVYVLPQRSLVAQTAETARAWLAALGLEGDVGLSVLMGGSIDHAWDLEPDKSWIIVGTQDQILSRALNRGYGGVSRFRWPLQFALLHNDVQWVVDEVQLFGDGLATTAQLQAFRERFGTHGPAHTLWMSATASPEWLQTVDLREAGRELEVWELDDADREALRARLVARKPLERCPVILDDEASKKPEAYAKKLAEWLLGRRPADGLTLVILNRVDRAQVVYQALKRAAPEEDVRLAHGQFRARDRAWLAEQARSLGDTRAILVATQVVEAGMDLDATALVTELAPWSSLIQRFGRLNRTGTREAARAFWIDIARDSKVAYEPYHPADLDRARAQLERLEDVGPSRLPGEIDPLTYQRVLRRRDLLQLFDTTPDLGGNDIDVSPFIREIEDRTVSVYWGEWTGDAPPDALRAVADEDVCRVPMSRLQEYLKKKRKVRGAEQTRVAYIWNSLIGRFEEVKEQRVFPGRLYLLRAEDGGYSPDLGFDPDLWSTVPNPVEARGPGEVDAEDGEEDNGPSPGRPVTLEEHTLDVMREAEALRPLAGSDEIAEVLREAAFWHDSGKRHPLFQAKLRLAALGEEAYREKYGSQGPGQSPVYPPDEIPMLAKSGGRAGLRSYPQVCLREDRQSSAEAAAGQEGDHGGVWGGAEGQGEDRAAANAGNKAQAGQIRSIRGFRHELASGLAYLEQVPPEEANHLRTRLVAYLIAAHHGKIRGQIRASARERAPEDGRLFARGVWEGDQLPAYAVSSEGSWPEALLSLSVMRMGRDEAGRESWVHGVQRLLEAYGPFRLAWYEALLRVADSRASRREGGVEA